MRMELDRTIGWQTFLDECAEGFADFDRVLLVDKTERNLGGSFRCNDGLETFAGIAAGRARPCQFQNAAAFFAGWNGQTDRTEEVFSRAAKALP